VYGRPSSSSCGIVVGEKMYKSNTKKIIRRRKLIKVKSIDTKGTMTTAVIF
jgi:hypothetical protein